MNIHEYLAAHGLSRLEADGFGIEMDEARHSFSIPVRDESGKVLFRKTRHLDNGKGPKYTYEKGTEASLFGIEQPFRKEDRSYYIVEGEIDSLALRAKGIPAVSGTGGSSTWRDEWTRQLDGLARPHDLDPVILYDRDEAGYEGAYRVWSSFREHSVAPRIALIPASGGCKDAAEYLGRGFDPMAIECVEMPQIDVSSGKVRHIVSLRNAVRQCIEMEASCPEFRGLVEVFRRHFAAEMRFLNRRSPNNRRSGVPGVLDISRIRSVPVSDFVEVRNGWAKCVFHDDHEPSMKVNGPSSRLPNTVKCFSCGRFGSVIDVVMAINDCSFGRAVDIIRGRIGGPIV